MESRGKKSIKPRSEKCIVDRLSPLPDDILHHILSFLDFLDVARTCVLSKRWRDVWMSVPCLNFDMIEYWHQHHNMEDEYWEFIKWALLLRDGSEIRRIHFTFDEIEQLNWLLRFAASKKVSELSFINGEPREEELEFPRLLCKTLKSLTVHFKNEITIRVSTAFSSLKSLVLEGVSMSRDAAEKLLSSDCVELEDVYLEEIRVGDLEIINISARKLKNLTIKNICYCNGFTFARSFISKLNICAPNLVSFSYKGPMLCGFAFMDTVSLQHISISIPHIPSAYQGSNDETFLPCPTRFIGLNHAKDLTLSSRVVKYFAPTYFDPLGITFILDNMNCLKLGLRRTVDYIEGLINLLKLSPNLEALAISFTQVFRLQLETKRATETGEGWKSRVEDIACLSYHVKKIQIFHYDSSKIAFQLVKFLLRNSKVLESMEIMHVRPDKIHRKKLIALPRASSKVVMCITNPRYRFHEDDSCTEDD